MIKTKRQVFYSAKFDQPLPVYRTPCTFEKNGKGEEINKIQSKFHQWIF